MKLTRGTKHLSPASCKHSSCVATIGNFDGLHLGHRTIIQQVKSLAHETGCETTVISFEPLPTEYFCHKLGKPLPGRIYPLRDKVRILNHLGIDQLVCLKFSDELSEMSPEDFITDILVQRLNVQHLIVGDDFRFGKQRRGDFQMLDEIGAQWGMKVSSTPTIEQDDGRISSTRVRQHLSRGELAEATQLLGEPYLLSGRIRHGDKRGRTIGFPTLNQSLRDDIVAAKGAYAVRVHGLASKPFNGVANLGKRPTVAGTEMRLETHVFDFEQQVYGQHACIELVSYLRPEQKFAGLDELIAQIEADSAIARQILE